MGKNVVGAGGGLFSWGEEYAACFIVDADDVGAEEIHAQDAVKAFFIFGSHIYHCHGEVCFGEVTNGDGIEGCHLRPNIGSDGSQFDRFAWLYP